MKKFKYILKNYWPFLIIAGILAQTLFYKFSAHPESVALFQKIHLFGLPEVYGRLGVGTTELLVSIGLFFKQTRMLALIGVIGIMIGALYFHFTIIGFEGNNLALAISAFVALCLAIYSLFFKTRISS